MTYRIRKLSEQVSLIQEAGVANFMRCNIWYVRGRNCDLIIDTGMGLSSLKQFIEQHQTSLRGNNSQHPLKAIVTHCHFDHSGCLHEFDIRLGHPAEADNLAHPTAKNVVFDGDWSRISIVDMAMHPHYSPSTYQITAAPLTDYLDEGDVIDLGDRTYQVHHLPGHSPGSIGLWDRNAKTLFSGDAIYDGELLDQLYHSDKLVYATTLERIESLGAEVVHAGHFPSFGRQHTNALIASYRSGTNTIQDVEAWYRENANSEVDMFADQDWSAISKLPIT